MFWAQVREYDYWQVDTNTKIVYEYLERLRGENDPRGCWAQTYNEQARCQAYELQQEVNFSCQGDFKTDLCDKVQYKFNLCLFEDAQAECTVIYKDKDGKEQAVSCFDPESPLNLGDYLTWIKIHEQDIWWTS